MTQLSVTDLAIELTKPSPNWFAVMSMLSRDYLTMNKILLREQIDQLCEFWRSENSQHRASIVQLAKILQGHGLVATSEQLLMDSASSWEGFCAVTQEVMQAHQKRSLPNHMGVFRCKIESIGLSDLKKTSLNLLNLLHGFALKNPSDEVVKNFFSQSQYASFSVRGIDLKSTSGFEAARKTMQIKYAHALVEKNISDDHADHVLREIAYAYGILNHLDDQKPTAWLAHFFDVFPVVVFEQALLRYQSISQGGSKILHHDEIITPNVLKKLISDVKMFSDQAVMSQAVSVFDEEKTSPPPRRKM